MFDAVELTHELLVEMLTPAGAKPLDVRRVARAITSQHLAREHTGYYEAAQSPMFEPRAYSSVCTFQPLPPSYAHTCERTHVHAYAHAPAPAPAPATAHHAS